MRCPPVPRFFFHVRDDIEAPDNEGAELPDLEAARDKALHEARSMMCETLLRDGRISLDHHIDIEDEQGELRATVQFADAVRIER